MVYECDTCIGRSVVTLASHCGLSKGGLLPLILKVQHISDADTKCPTMLAPETVEQLGLTLGNLLLA